MDGPVTPVELGYAPAAAPAPAAPGAPLPCPLCEYDLRGLSEPRCPECGYAFTWEELRDPRRRFHPYLFEHHPERNAWSLANTLIGGLTPRQFWSTLYPTQPSRPRRLVAYWLLCALPLLAAAAVHAWLNVTGMIRATGLRWRQEPAILARWAIDYDIEGGAPVLMSLMALAWPWVTLAALLVFRVSMRRARVRWTHVLRCVLYTADLCVWCAPPLALVTLFIIAGRVWPPQNPLGDAWALLPAALLLVAGYRLFAAYRLYLRFDHALATVLASQVIVVLVFVKLWYVAQGF